MTQNLANMQGLPINHLYLLVLLHLEVDSGQVAVVGKLGRVQLNGLWGTNLNITFMCDLSGLYL